MTVALTILDAIAVVAACAVVCGCIACCIMVIGSDDSGAGRL